MSTAIYRICTENVNKPQVLELVSQYFDCFSVWEGVGYWKGQQEASLCIEIMVYKKPVSQFRFKISPDIEVSLLANEIRMLNNQEAVLIQRLDVEPIFVYADRIEHGMPTEVNR